MSAGKTKKRRGMFPRPLTQYGLVRVPTSVNNRPRELGVPKKRTTLDAYNKTLEGCTLHPTKGYRFFNEARFKTAARLAELLGPPREVGKKTFYTDKKDVKDKNGNIMKTSRVHVIDFSKYNGAVLKQVRAHNGVGRPPRRN